MLKRPFCFSSLACVPSELGGSQMGQLDQRCGNNYASSVEIPNGVVCYNGSSTGAEAVYFCNDGYQLEGEGRRVCQSDGLWNGSVPTCDLIISTPTTGMNCVLFCLASICFIAPALLLGSFSLVPGFPCFTFHSHLQWYMGAEEFCECKWKVKTGSKAIGVGVIKPQEKGICRLLPSALARGY